MKKLLLLTMMLLASSVAMASEQQNEAADKAAVNVGKCEATNTVYVNIQETAAITIETFMDVLPSDLQSASRANITMLRRLATLQRIQNDALEIASGEVVEHFNIDKKEFQKIKDEAFNSTMKNWLASMSQLADDKKEFADAIQTAVATCVEEFRP